MPATFAIQRTEAVGPASEKGCLRLFLSDRSEQDQPPEWIAIQIETDTRAGLQLAVVQLRALQKAHAIIDAEIEALRLLEGRSPEIR